MQIKSGDKVQWQTWCGTATATVAIVSDYRVSCVADPWGSTPMYWEATQYHTLEEAMKGVTIIPA